MFQRPDMVSSLERPLARRTPAAPDPDRLAQRNDSNHIALSRPERRFEPAGVLAREEPMLGGMGERGAGVLAREEGIPRNDQA
ncbi:MAG TPA: hypothetical protein VGS41_09950 [Chthonomonadales bacterium]|nr:hypothetical protein [Chthonomonadales bacterium]